MSLRSRETRFSSSTSQTAGSSTSLGMTGRGCLYILQSSKTHNVSSHTLFQFRPNHKFPLRRIVFDAQQVRLATDLAVFNIRLPAASVLIHRCVIKLAASGTLKSGLHITILGRTAAASSDSFRPSTRRRNFPTSLGQRTFHKLFTLLSPVFHAALLS